MKSSQRIIINTLATYSRSIVGAGLVLFSSRWVLNALGDTDFGLFSVVGSLIAFVIFLNSVTAASVSRHFAYSIGQGDNDGLVRWFNAAFSIHLCLAGLLTILGWFIGQYIIVSHLTIPDNRMVACLWVFRISLIAIFFSMASVPFVAMFTAKQQLFEIAAWGMVQSVLTFALAFLLSYIPGDRLIFYSAGMALIHVGVQVAQVLRAYAAFRECVMVGSYWFDKKRLKDIFSFVIWSLFGGLGATFRDQGSAILLNLFAGPRVNAAYGIAMQVSSQANQLAASMLGAFAPEITATEGRGDRERTISLSLRVCKLGTLLVLFFAIPLIVEMDYVLKLWLIDPPVYTSIFCQLILCAFLIDRLTSGYMLAVNAHGKIAAYQATAGTSLILTLPLAWLFLKVGYSPTSVGSAFILTMTACSMSRVFWVKHLFGIDTARWIHSVVKPCLMVTVTATATAILSRWILTESFVRLVLTTVASAMASLLIAWFWAFDKQERELLGNNVLHILRKVLPISDRIR